MTYTYDEAYQASLGYFKGNQLAAKAFILSIVEAYVQGTVPSGVATPCLKKASYVFRRLFSRVNKLNILFTTIHLPKVDPFKSVSIPVINII